jgi:hypothetical protein
MGLILGAMSAGHAADQGQRVHPHPGHVGALQRAGKPPRSPPAVACTVRVASPAGCRRDVRTLALRGLPSSCVVGRDPYRQVLPDLQLSIERYTSDVPADGGWYLIRAGAHIGRFRSLKAAQEAWRAVVSESGWTPQRKPIDAANVRRREQMERWSRNRAG